LKEKAAEVFNGMELQDKASLGHTSSEATSELAHEMKT
jgi:hypothetical protein